MDGLTRALTRLLDDHALNFRRLRHLVLDPYDVRHATVLRTEARLKSHASVWRHIDVGDAVEELHDLTGFRIITLYADHVEPIVAELAKQFPGTTTVRHDKPNGYVTTNVRVRLEAHEAARFGLEVQGSTFAFETQVRSAMQHLWATLEREYQYAPEPATAGPLVTPFVRLAKAARAFDDDLVRVRSAAQAERQRGASATRPGRRRVPIDVETLTGAIATGGAATLFDADMAAWRSLDEVFPTPNRKWVANAAAMLHHLGETDLRKVLDRLKRDTEYRHWLEMYNRRRFLRAGSRAVYRGETVVLYPQYLAAQQGKPALQAAFAAAGVTRHDLVRRLFATVQVPFQRARAS